MSLDFFEIPWIPLGFLLIFLDFLGFPWISLDFLGSLGASKLSRNTVYEKVVGCTPVVLSYDASRTTALERVGC